MKLWMCCVRRQAHLMERPNKDFGAGNQSLTVRDVRAAISEDVHDPVKSDDVPKHSSCVSAVGRLRPILHFNRSAASPDKSQCMLCVAALCRVNRLKFRTYSDARQRHPSLLPFLNQMSRGRQREKYLGRGCSDPAMGRAFFSC